MTRARVKPGTHRAVLATILLLCLVGSLQAQDPAPGPCSYMTCALKISERRIQAGAEGREVGSLGLFSPPRLLPLFQSADSALFYQGVVEQNYTSGRVMNALGALSLAASYFLVSDDPFDGADTVGVVLIVPGVVLGLLGSRRVRRANRALASAIWWYNATLPTGPE